jgi:hypothetical protein
VTSKEVLAALRRRYCLPEWALFTEVQDKTGVENRRADAIACNMYESKGLIVVGFEIKVNRSDWLVEAANPEKMATMRKFCNQFYVVASEDIVQEKELPEGVGLMIASRDINKTIVTKICKWAANTEAEITKPFVACLLRRASQDVEKYKEKYIKIETIVYERELT